MRSCLLVILYSLFFLFPCFADDIRRGTISSVAEEDGSLEVYPYQLKVPNTSLTDNGDGTASIAFIYPGLGIALSTGSAWDTSITNSAGLLSALNDETGTGLAVFGTTPTFTTSLISPLIIGGTATTADLTLQTTSGIGATGADMHFLVGNNGATEAMTILNNGNVGIGTTAPGALLHLEGAGAAAELIFQRNDSTTGNGIIRFRGSDNLIDAEIAYNNAVGGALTFSTGAGGATTQMTILDNGNLGIGTTAPATKLDVAGDMQVSSAVALSLGGYVRKYTEATATLTGANTTIQVNIPAGARILGTQLRVDTLVASADGGTSWAATYSGGATQAIGAAGQAFTKNTKTNALFNDTTETDIVGSETDILIDCDGAFTFSAGVIRAIVYWETVTAMGNAA